MDALLTRIRLIQEHKSKSVRHFAQILGIPQVSVNKMITGNQAVSARLLLSIATAFPDVSAEWLLRGEGEMLRSSKQETYNVDMSSVNGNNNVVGSTNVNYNNDMNAELNQLKGQVELLKEILQSQLQR